MIAIFYDRRNKQEVTSEQLMPIKFVHFIATADPDDLVETGRRCNPITHEPMDEKTFQEYITRQSPQTLGDLRKIAWDWHRWEPETTPARLFLTKTPLGDFGYKSPECPKEKNWDLVTFTNDLVFLRLE